MIRNGFLALGPNVTGYPGGYPRGFLAACRRMGFWGRDRLHLCSGTVHDGVTVDLDRSLRPTVVCDLEVGVPFKNQSFDAVFIDPPYSAQMADQLYAKRLINVPRLLKDAIRVVRPSGWLVVLDWTVWAFSGFHNPKGVRLVALYAVYVANPGPKPLRALEVWRKGQGPLESFQ